MLKTCAPLLGKWPDRRLWSMKLQRHASGEFSMAVIQGNESLEDQCQVFTSQSYTMIGVYDGHGGSFAARFVNENLIPRLESLVAQGGISEAAILGAFNNVEDNFYLFARPKVTPDSRVWQEVGSCCIVGVISHERLYVANLGDSRAVVGFGVKGRPFEAQRLTTDHNVNNFAHRSEFLADQPDAVTFDSGSFNVKGCIQVTKSIGDFHLKRNSMKRDNIEFDRPVLSAVPVVTDRNLTIQDQFVIFASKGFWDLVSDQAAVDIVYNNKRSGIAKRLIEVALHAAAKNSNIPYERMLILERGNRRRIHDDFSVVVLYLDHRSRSGVTNGSFNPPLDIFTDNVLRNS